MSASLRASGRLLVYVIWTLVLIPLHVVGLVAKLRLVESLPVFYHRSCRRILGLRVEQSGQISSARPTLFVVNHVSYLDITVLGSLIPGSFVAKAEVAGWPFFGLLAKLQRTVFVDRRTRSTARHRDAILQRLETGGNLILFPEGTSSDGNRVLPFRSALFSVVEQKTAASDLAVQPVSLAYTRLDGIPLGYRMRPLLAWYGDMPLMGHLWRMLGLGTVTVEVTFHPVVNVDSGMPRRVIARHCQETVARGVSVALSGRAYEGLPDRSQP